MRRRRLQRGANPRGHLGRDLGCGGVIGAEVGQFTADPVKCGQHLRGGSVGANPLAQLRGGGVVEQARLQVGQQLGRDRYVGSAGLVARVVVHRCPRRSCHALTQASLHHEGLDGRSAATVPRITH